MKISIHSSLIHFLVFGSIVALLFSACDVAGDQNVEWRPGNSLSISGPTVVEVPDTAEYYIHPFTINKDYVWTVNDSELDSTQLRRDGEFADVIFTEPGTYTIGINDGEYEGTLEVTATDTVPTP